ncbi:MAG: hypothetical protein ACI915_002412 [Gammaproteobacteria bacterium]|jgi:hypothetical protein
MVRATVVALLTWLCFSPTLFAAWSISEADGEGSVDTAYIENSARQRADIFLDEHDVVYLRLRLSAGFETLTRSSCPTFQIDKRLPLHHYAVGKQCSIDSKDATIVLGQISDKQINSLVLHRIMNGNKVTFRYTTENGQYRKAEFSLQNSKQALQGAVGADTEVTVD